MEIGLTCLPKKWPQKMSQSGASDGRYSAMIKFIPFKNTMAKLIAAE